jgi:hypothetical protein
MWEGNCFELSKYCASSYESTRKLNSSVSMLSNSVDFSEINMCEAKMTENIGGSVE